MCFRNAELSVGTLGILIACSFKLDIKMLYSGASQLSGSHQEITETIFYYQTDLKFDMRVVEGLGTI